MKLLIKFPTRERPNKFFNVLKQYYDLMDDKSNYQFVISCDSDDKTMNNEKAINAFKTYPNLNYHFDNNENKIVAINSNLDKYDFDIVLLASDDMIPRVKGYDTIIRNKMKKYFPDNDGVLWFNDGFVHTRLNTLCILGKKYYDRFGFIYNPVYKSECCDNEFMGIANMLRKQIYFPECIIAHEHPANGFGHHRDELYDRNMRISSNNDYPLHRGRADNFYGITDEEARKYKNKVRLEDGRYIELGTVL